MFHKYNMSIPSLHSKALLKEKVGPTSGFNNILFVFFSSAELTL